ncbi:unnamed protein product [Adineta steineri]|uniref:Uncharacterized protein n=1 Tax=Adineta steineri TaxID=433720 RepID=A0A814W745_9BILA|nr:unnamed protein product [Adineta steineri]
MLFSANEDSIRSLSEHNSELNVDQPINEITHPHSSSSSLTLDIEQTNNLLENKPIVYENESIIQQFSNEFSVGSATDVYATMRQCGGSHTTTLPFKRQIKTQPAVPEETLLARNEVDIKGQDGMIYKGRITVDKLPSVDLHKKNSVVLLAPPPLLRSRSDSHPLPSPHQHQRDSFGNDQERNSLSPTIPNLEPIIPRETSFT